MEAGVDPLFGSVPEFDPEPLPEPFEPGRFESMPEIEAALGIGSEAGDEPGGGDQDERGSTRLLEPVPDPGEITVSASSEIGSTLKEDWLSEARPGATMEWPSVAPGRTRSQSAGDQDHPPRNQSFFPSPDTTEWSVGELDYRRRPAG